MRPVHGHGHHGSAAAKGDHTHAGQEWFNKERFETLLQWLLTFEAIGLATLSKKPARLITAIAPLRKTIHQLKTMAETAGYRVGRYLELLQQAS